MKKRITITMILALLIVALLASCSAPPTDKSSTETQSTKAEETKKEDSPKKETTKEETVKDDPAKKIKVAVVVAEYNEWNHIYFDAAVAKCNELGWEAEVFDAAQNVEQQINLMNSIIAQKFDVITIQPADNAALAPAMKKAAEAGITVVCHYDIDESLGINDLIYQNLFGQKEAGILEAEEYVKLAGEKGKVALIAGLTGADNAQRRSAGMREVFEKYPEIEIVSEVYCDWDRQKAMAAAEDILAANADLDAFIVQDDGMAWGVWEAIDKAKKQDQVKIASQGFYESSIPAIKEGKFMFTISYPPSAFAEGALEMARKALANEPVERIEFVGMELVTKENVDTAKY